MPDGLSHGDDYKPFLAATLIQPLPGVAKRLVTFHLLGEVIDVHGAQHSIVYRESTLTRWLRVRYEGHVDRVAKDCPAGRP